MIPIELREELSKDPFYWKCCITGEFKEATRGDGSRCKIEFHHNLIFAGRQVQEKECILPVTQEVHAQARNVEMREKLDLVMLRRMSDVQIDYFSKAVNLRQRLKYLENKFSP